MKNLEIQLLMHPATIAKEPHQKVRLIQFYRQLFVFKYILETVGNIYYYTDISYF